MGAELLMNLSPLQVEGGPVVPHLPSALFADERAFAMVVQSCLGISFHRAEGVQFRPHLIVSTNPNDSRSRDKKLRAAEADRQGKASRTMLAIV